MKAKELIDQYVTAHADNRWIDASELEALLTEFAEKLKEPASEDLEECASEIILEGANFNKSWYAHPELAFKAGAQWQREHMMKDAVEGELDCDDNGSWCSFDSNIVPISQAGNKVKVIIIKE